LHPTSRRSSVSSRACCRRSSAGTPSSSSRPRLTRSRAIELAEALATSDVPGGVVNILTGYRSEMAPHLAAHMDVNAIDLCGADGHSTELEESAAETSSGSSAAAPTCRAHGRSRASSS